MKRCSLLLAAVVLAAMTTEAVAIDRVVVHRGAPILGRLTKITPTEVVIEANGRANSVAVNRIREVEFDNEPEELKRARARIRGGQHADALTELEKIDLTTARDYIRKDVLFYIALAEAKLALGGSGNLEAATARMKNWLAKEGGKTSYHMYEAFEVFGDLAVAAQQFDAASQAYKVVASAPWPDYQLRARVLSGRALLAQNRAKEALDQFQFVIDSNEATPVAEQQKQMATLGKAVALAKTGNASAGIDLVKGFIKRTEPRDTALFARAYNALGAAYLAAGKKEEALLAYLHTDSLFNQDGEAHAEALYHLTSLWKDLGKLGRSKEARNLLFSQYKNSLWARRAASAGG